MNQNYKTIDLETWERRDIYNGFIKFDYPNSVVGVETDIARALAFWKQRKLSPFLALVYAVCRSANHVPAFKQRIRGEKAIELEVVHADFTVPKDNGSFGIKVVEYNDSFQKFSEDASNPALLSLGSPGDGDINSDHFVYMSSMPWVRFTHLVQATDKRSGSIPRIAWGKFSKEGSKVMLPLSIQTHHSLVDGIHVAQFIEHLETLLAHPEEVFNS